MPDRFCSYSEATTIQSTNCQATIGGTVQPRLSGPPLWTGKVLSVRISEKVGITKIKNLVTAIDKHSNYVNTESLRSRYHGYANIVSYCGEVNKPDSLATELWMENNEQTTAWPLIIFITCKAVPL